MSIAEIFEQALRYHQQGDLRQAEPLYRAVVRADPNHADAHHLLGVLLHQTGRPEEAYPLIRRAIALAPDVTEYHFNLGTILADRGRQEQAIACLHEALRLKPLYAEAMVNLGTALRELGQLPEAAEYFRKASELNPRSAEQHNNLGVVLRDMGLTEEAIVCYRRALACDPQFAKAYSDLGMALNENGNMEEGLACYLAALKLRPHDISVLGQLIHQQQHLCVWDGLMERSEHVVVAIAQDLSPTVAQSLSPFSFLAMPIATTPAQQLRCGQLKSSTYSEEHLTLPPRPPGKKKLTLGYLSTDFRKHAVGFLIAELFELHNRDRFEVIGYSHGPDDGSAIRRRISEAFDRFVDLRTVSYMESARRIAADGVDILIDLNGYTGKHRTPILALRPAPIQVSYLGFPTTTGSAFMDYILVDDFIVPADQQPFYSEKLVHLPCYQVNDRKREIAARTPTRAECGLPAEGFVFCAFNNTYKITPRMFDLWMDVLKEVPGSVLWLLDFNPFSGANLRREAAARGVAAERIVSAPMLPLEEHLARQRVADLFLDTFPYCAHTTASDVLWAGCPLLTLAGDTFVSRVAGSVLRTIGLPELATRSYEEYKATALSLARNPAQLAALRERLAANRETSTLFDSTAFTRNLEKAFGMMWEIHVAGERPRPLRIDPLHVPAPVRNIHLANSYRDQGHIALQQGKLADAQACYHTALEHNPECLQSLNNLGSVLHQQGRLAEATACFQRAVQVQPDSSRFHGNLGVLLQETRKWDEAVVSYRRSLDLDPNNTASLEDLVHLLANMCQWQDLDDVLVRMKAAARIDPRRALTQLLSPFTLLNLANPATAQEQLACAQKEYSKSAVVPNQRLVLPARRAGKSKITLGYLSADYRQHAVSYLIAELFELHDRNHFEVFGYSYGPDDGGPLRRRLVRAFDKFVDMRNMSFLESAQHIAADEVDILIDLTGYTTHHRMPILALCPAPLQVNYLGYPGTMGADVMDYIIVDDFIVPPAQQPFYTEKLVHLPCYEVNDSQREISPHTPTRVDCGLPAEGFVFCDFNNTFKVNPRMFDLWMDLLKEISGSVLWLYEGNRFVAANLRREAALRGVAPERLVFAPKRPLPEHLARYRLADLFLDTYPYGALTTASDALWAGCPLLALVGETFVSRVAGSLLRTIGLPELITHTFDEYKAMALRLARNPDELANLRTRLAANRLTSSLFDAKAFARNLEKAYTTMWEIYAAGEKPRGFAID